MKGKLELVVNRYRRKDTDPEKVWANVDADELRRKECLCLNCERMYDTPQYSSCRAAQEFFELLKKHNSAITMTRCGATDEDGELMYRPLENLVH